MASQHEGEHEAHVGPDVHLPDPSIWPIIVGIAAAILGAALIWWASDTDSDFAGPLLGAAIAIVLVAAGGWAYEDGRMKKKAEEGSGHAGEARFTQVVTFALAPGQGEIARGSEGILGILQSQENALRDLPGFQDLRIVASPGEQGAGQVLVETTWSDRHGLATYDQTRQTVLDLVAAHPSEVVPGSVQVFDMEVLRDTKDVAVRFGLGTAMTLIGGLGIFGLLVGAGLTIFDEEDTGGGGGGNGAEPTPPPTGFDGTIVEQGIKYLTTEFRVPPDTSITLTEDNQDAGTPHNIRFFTTADFGGDTLGGCTEGCIEGDQAATPITPGPAVQTLTFTTPAVGEYAYWCDIHPDQMRGVMIVEEGAPVPGETGGGGTDGGDDGDGGGASGDLTVVAENTTFDPTELTAPANTEVNLVFDNRDASPPHNIQIFAGPEPGGDLLTGCTAGCPGDTVESDIITGPTQVTLTFTTPGPGEYYYDCILHPNEMNGILVVQ